MTALARLKARRGGGVDGCDENVTVGVGVTVGVDTDTVTLANALAGEPAAIAAYAERCLRLEIDTWPKPGLVSHVDSGSHDDMDADTFRHSAAAIQPYFAELAAAGARGADMQMLRRIGLRAEHAMLAATDGINTHRGAIFGLGLLCAAAGARAAVRYMANGCLVDRRAASGRTTSERTADRRIADRFTVENEPLGACAGTLGTMVARYWGDAILGGPRPSDSHGECAGRRYGVGGARQEAAGGYASVYRIGVPALREAARYAPDDAEAVRVHACFALIAAVDDTNLLHRGGREGLAFAQRTARDFLDRGGVSAVDWRVRAAAAHRGFVARRLSPGGAADLLAMSLFVQAFEPEPAP